jgi:hypothetical protein
LAAKLSDASGRLNSLEGDDSAARTNEGKLASDGCTPWFSTMLG